MDLKELGITKIELQDRLVDKVTDCLLGEADRDDGYSFLVGEDFQAKLDEKIKGRIDKAIDDMAEKHVLGKVDELIKGWVLRKTTGWGEAKGEPVSLTEYLVQRASSWMSEQVDYNGKSKSENSYGSWNGSNSRLGYAVDEYLGHYVKNAMETTLQNANHIIADSLKEGVAARLDEIRTQIQVSVKTGS